jgi:hypothetical protein
MPGILPNTTVVGEGCLVFHVGLVWRCARWVMTSENYIYLNLYPRHALLCLRVEVISLVPCEGAPRWEKSPTNTIRLLDAAVPGVARCLGRSVDGKLRLKPCSGEASQIWAFDHGGASQVRGDGVGEGPGAARGVC